MNNFNPESIFRELVKSGEEWAELECLAQQLEETKKPVLNSLKLQSPEKADSARETWAYAQKEYTIHVNGMVAARKKANIAKVRYFANKTLAELRRTEQSNRRSEMNLT